MQKTIDCSLLYMILADMVLLQHLGLLSDWHCLYHLGMMNVTTLMLELGADVNAETVARERPLTYALLRDNIPLLELLISYGAEINFVDAHGDCSDSVAKNTV